MTKEIRLLLACLLMCCATGYVVYRLCAKKQKIVVVDALKLFDSYNMKKQLETMAKAKLQEEGRVIDSLRNALSLATAKRNTEDVDKLMRTLELAKQKLEDDYTSSNKEINQQVWKRLNILLAEYGKSQRLNLIVGANGMGSVLYTDENYDQTNKVIEFANRRYEEGN